MKTALYIALTALAAGIVLALAGCGGSNNDNNLVTLDISNLTPISNPSFTYAAWARRVSTNDVVKLDTFNTQPDGSLKISRFALSPELQAGDQVFITIQPVPDPDPQVPTNTVVLTGTIQGNTAVLLFPEMQGFSNTSGIATVSGAGNRQLLTDFTNLPDVADDNFIYQGWLDVNGSFIPMQKFAFDAEPVSFNASVDLTTAGYFLSVEPVPDPDPSKPTSIRPFFTNGTLQPIENQPLVRSSLTPNSANFNFPSAVATVQ